MEAMERYALQKRAVVHSTAEPEVSDVRLAAFRLVVMLAWLSQVESRRGRCELDASSREQSGTPIAHCVHLQCWQTMVPRYVCNQILNM